MPHNMRALVVDDNHYIRKLLKEILIDDGAFVAVEEAADGIAALDLLLAEEFDLAIVDIDIPGRDGLSLIAEVKRSKPEQSFLVLSALPVSDYAERAAMLGAPFFLAKGCLPVTILAAVRRAIGG